MSIEFTATLPDGLDTKVGEGGYGLSGGQAQRVAIARAFLKNAPLLLLDEPTAHLDPATEAEVLDSLRRLALGRTVILASHSAAAHGFAGRRWISVTAGSCWRVVRHDRPRRDRSAAVLRILGLWRGRAGWLMPAWSFRSPRWSPASALMAIGRSAVGDGRRCRWR